MTTLEIFNISPITYCHNPGYNPIKRVKEKADEEKVKVIERVIEQAYGVTFSELQSHHRKHAKVRVRQIAMYLLRWHANVNLAKLGEMFGGRDHTTVIHSTNTVENIMSVDAEFRAEIKNLEYLVSAVRNFDGVQIAIKSHQFNLKH